MTLFFGAMNVDQLFEEVRHLAPADRLRLAARIVHDVAERAAVHADSSSLMGMMADEPEVMDEVCRLAMSARRSSECG